MKPQKKYTNMQEFLEDLLSLEDKLNNASPEDVKEIKAEIARLKSEFNKLQGIEKEVESTQDGLKISKISESEYNVLENRIFCTYKIQQIYSFRKKIDFRKEIEKRIEILDEHVHSLDLSHTSNYVYPKNLILLTGLPYLKKLNLCGNNWDSKILNSVCKLYELKELDISHNKISYGDAGSTLKFEYDYLKTNLRNLRNLEVFIADYNPATFLPKDYCELPWLRHISVSHNNLQELPKNISNLSELEYLNAGNNLIEEISYLEISKLRKLKTLNLGGNRIHTLPKSLILLVCDGSLKEFYIKGNPLNIYEDGTKTVLNYMTEKGILME